MLYFSIDNRPELHNICWGVSSEDLYDLVNVSGRPEIVFGKYRVKGIISWLDDWRYDANEDFLLQEISVTPYENPLTKVWREGKTLDLKIEKGVPVTAWTNILTKSAYTDKTGIVHHREINTKSYDRTQNTR